MVFRPAALAIGLCVCGASIAERLGDIAGRELHRPGTAAVTAVTVRPTFFLVPGRSVLLPERVAESMVRHCSRVDVPDLDGTWTPSQRDVEALERDIHALNSRLARARPRRLTVNQYHRQYVGIVVRGRRLIYINALLNGWIPSSWRSEPFDMCDGGWAAWGCAYEPADHTFGPIYINGFA